MQSLEKIFPWQWLKGVCFVLCFAFPLCGAYSQEEADSSKLQSLFYSDVDVEKIRQALMVYRNRKSGKDDGSAFDIDSYISHAEKIKEARSKDRYFTYPQFFMESLVFHTDADWIVWLNGQKITPQTNNDEAEIKVLSIGKDEVSIQWRPFDMERVLQSWEKWPNEEVQVDNKLKTVYFTLRPNQTFSSYVMRILEGKVMPVTIDNQQIEKDFPVAPVDISGTAESLENNIMPQDQEEDYNTSPPINAVSPAPAPAFPAGVANEIIGIYGNPEDKKIP